MRKRRDAGRRTLAHTGAHWRTAGTPCTARAHYWRTHWHALARTLARTRHAHVLAQRSAHSRAYLSLCRSAVTRNYSEKVINKVLDLVSGSQNMELLQARATAPPRHQMLRTLQEHPAGRLAGR